jgi:acyl-CoA dehydrogenase
MKAAGNPDRAEGLRQFDGALFGHIGFAISNAVRSLWFGLTGASIGAAPGVAYTKRYYRKLNRYSAVLALMADTSMLLLGGKLKFKESLSGRLGDVLSQLYIASAMLKRYEDQGRPTADQPLLAWSFHNAMHKLELSLSAALRNFPVRPVGWLLWALVFPLGRRAEAPSDRLSRKVSSILMSPNEARERLGRGAFLTPGENNPAGRINGYLAAVVAAEPVERKFQKAIKGHEISTLDFPAQLDLAIRNGAITTDERRQLEELREMTIDAISVDDFEPWELRSAGFGRDSDPQASRAAA